MDGETDAIYICTVASFVAFPTGHRSKCFINRMLIYMNTFYKKNQPSIFKRSRENPQALSNGLKGLPAAGYFNYRKICYL